MSSAKTKNTASNRAGRRGTSAGRTSRSRSTQQDEPSDREFDFTLFYDGPTAEQVKQVTLSENKSFGDLKREVHKKFNIPVNNQLLLYGWPVTEPQSDAVLMRELNLPSDEVILSVAELAVSPPSPAALSEHDFQYEAASQFSSASQHSPASQSLLSSDDQVIINMYDAKNGVPYDEVYFQGAQTVEDVKRLFASFTNISLEFQEWSGWPDGAHNDKKLRDIRLDRPIHSLQLQENLLVIQLDTDEASPSSNLSISAGDNQSALIVASNAQKTLSQVLEDLRNQQQSRKLNNHSTTDDQSNPGNVDVELETQTTSTLQERIVEDDQMPSTSRQGINISRRELSEHPVSVPKKVYPKRDIEASEPAPENLTPKMDLESESTPTEIKREINSESEPIVERIVVKEEESVENSESESNIDSELLITPTKKRPAEGIGEVQTKKFKSHRKNEQPPFIKFLKFRSDDEKSAKAVRSLLRYIEPVSQLSLRRVCKATKSWVTRNGEEHASREEEEKWSRYRLTVTGIDMQCFENVVNMNLPITRYKFDVWGELFYERMDIFSFMASAGHRVKDLTLTRFFMFQNTNERDMFNSFTRLEKLTIDQLVVSESPASHPCPVVLGQLQVLKLNYEIQSPQENSLIRPKCWAFTWEMLTDCSSLMYFRFPRVKEGSENPIANSEGIFAPLMDYISHRERIGGVAIEYLDLKHFNDSQSNYINRFVFLLKRCHAKDIKLKNVHALVIQQVVNEDGDTSDTKYKFCENIISLINFTQFVQNAPFRNLEKISLDVIPSVNGYSVVAKGYKDIFWPKLKTIKIKDSVQVRIKSKVWYNWQEIQEDLYGHNNNDVFDRKSVQYLRIDSPKAPYFLSEGHLAKKFYNLKRLEITSWFDKDEPATLNKRFMAIWRKLKLEELKITNCPQLNDYSFIGEEEGSEGRDCNEDEDEGYVFHKLTPTLKKFTLGLDGVDGVTDLSFKSVFSRMMFKTFIVLSTEPINITEAALLKMEKRSFGRHIEYFPFNCWSSSKIDAGRFQRIGKRFRSIL